MSVSLDTDIDDDLASGSSDCPVIKTHTASEDRKDVIKKWKEITTERKMILAVIGRSGTGKTTLINNMLGVECEDNGGGTTTATHSHGNDIEGIQIEIFDTPGLGMADRDEKHIFVDLQRITEKKADALLYCLSILPNSKMDEIEVKIIKKLTHMFGKCIWEKVIIVFTFANIMLQMNDGDMDRFKAVTKSYAKEFQSALNHIGVDSMVSVYDCLDNCDKPLSHGDIIISALPAGKNQQLPDGTRWDISIYEEVVKKCEKHGTPSLLDKRYTCALQ